MAVFLGWVNVTLLFLTIFLFLSTKINKHLFKGKSKLFQKFIKLSHNWHVYSATLLILVAMLHSYLALGGAIVFHSGYVLFASIVFAGIGGILFKFLNNKTILQMHKTFTIFVLFILVWHIVSVW